MAAYFYIIIPFEKFIKESEQLMNKYAVYLYAEKWNDERKFYYELIDYKNHNFSFLEDLDYRGFFYSFFFLEVQEGNLVSAKEKRKSTEKISFYDDNLFHYCIHGEGGREDVENLEMISLRMISKTPDKQIQQFYNALQLLFRKKETIKKGLQILNHFDNRIFYAPTNKKRLDNINNKTNQYLERESEL